MFWTIVGALMFVFFVVPVVLGLVLEILAELFETGTGPPRAGGCRI